MHPGGVLWISSDSDDPIMAAKIKNPKKFLGLPAKPPKNLGPEINPAGLEIISRLVPVISCPVKPIFALTQPSFGQTDVFHLASFKKATFISSRYFCCCCYCTGYRSSFPPK